jgi:AAA+ superfamily predicted ATPase
MLELFNMINLSCTVNETKRSVLPNFAGKYNRLFISIIIPLLTYTLGGRYLIPKLRQVYDLNNDEHLIVRILILIVVYVLYVMVLFFLDHFIVEYLDSLKKVCTQPCVVIEITKEKNKKVKDFVILENFLKNDLYFDENFRNKLIEIYNMININTKYFKQNTSVFLSGVPGVGKTEYTKKIVSLLGGGYIVHISRLISLKLQGVKILKEIFEIAKKKKKVLVFDDGEVGLIGRKFVFDKNQKNETISVIEILIYTLMDLISKKECNIIFTSNLFNVFDPAFSRRFDIALEFHFPEKSQLKGIWNLYLSNSPIGYDRNEMIDLFADLSYGLSGRDLAHIFKQIKKNKLNINNIADLIYQFKSKKKARISVICSKFFDDWFERNYLMEKI